MKRSTKNESFVRLSLEEIKSLHPQIEKLISDLQLSPIRQIPKNLLDTETLEHLLEIHPIRVCKREGSYFCTGNIRVFQTMKRLLPGNTSIQCILEATTLPDDYLNYRAMAELHYFPAILGVHAKDISALYQSYLKGVEQGFVTKKEALSASTFAKHWGSDYRKLKVPRPSDDSE